MYIFDEYDEYYRYPQGAVTDSETLKMRVLLSRGAYTGPRLRVQRDGGPDYTLPAEYAGARGSYGVYNMSFTPPEPGLYWYWFEADSDAGTVAIYNGPDQKPFQLTVYDADYKTPEWIKGGVMYQLFVDRFARLSETPPYVRETGRYRPDWDGTPDFRADENGVVRNDDFFGGSLDGVIEKLPYLSELGVTCIYLSPIFDAASNHKYDVGDYLKIDPAFGDEQTFVRLCKEAGELGMRVICDGVFNHVGVDSRYFNRFGRYDSLGAYQSQDSPYYDWFTFRNWNTDYDAWWNVKLLPSLNKNSESLKEFLMGDSGVLGYWSERGCGGWRLDVADELPDSFLGPLCASVKDKDPNALILGEVWEDASNKISYAVRRRYLLGGQLDSVTNYPLKDALIAYALGGGAAALADTMAALVQNYPKPALDCLMNIVGTHDTMRILTVLGAENLPDGKEAMSVFRLSERERRTAAEKLKIVSALQFTLPGFPCVFYGDEAGMEGGADPFCRGCYPWGNEDLELLDWYKNLARIRRSLPALHGGAYHLLWADGGIFAFQRGEADDAITITANISNLDVTIYNTRGIILGNKTE